MPRIESIHFCAGLGANSGKNLAESELLAIKLASKHHPIAEVFLHTSDEPYTADNYKLIPGLRRVTYDKSVYGAWPNWKIDGGAYMSDKLRLHVLLSCQASNALYLDTDAFCLQSLDHLADIEGTAMARLGPFMIANGLVYVGKDRKFIRRWYEKLAATKTSPKSAVDYSCRMPHELSLIQPGLTILDCKKYHGFTGDEAMQGAWCSEADSKSLSKMLTGVAVMHTMSPRPTAIANTQYELALNWLSDAAGKSFRFS